MPTLLVKNAELIVTMDGQDRELKDATIFCRDGFIEQIGSQADLPQTADDVLDRIDPKAMDQNVAAWAAFLWLLANSDVDFRALRPAQ